MASIARGIVTRDDSVYECFPDLALTPDGKLVCVYRECMGHAPAPFSRLVARRSEDAGSTWSPKQTLMELAYSKHLVEANPGRFEEDEIAEYQRVLARMGQNIREGGINCPRLICLQDGSLYLLADVGLANGVWLLMVWRSADGGATWDGPEELDLECGGLVPSLVQLRDGRLLMGLLLETKPGAPPAESYRSAVLFSSDGGQTWSAPVMLPAKEGFLPDEVSYVELDDGTIVGIGRNYALELAKRPSTACKVTSHDGGKTWSDPVDTWLIGCEGRPKAGLLRSGEVCITYRCDIPNEMLAMHLMTQKAAKAESLWEPLQREPLPEDTAAAQAAECGEERPWYLTSYYPGRTMILDMDRSVHRDAGYSGWAQLPDGDILVVDYINDDAPLAYIRSYRVRRSDIILFPEGDLPWLHPSAQPFRRMTLAMARRQERRNREPRAPADADKPRR